MDKKHVKDIIVKVLKLYAIIFCIVLPINILVSTLGGVFDGNLLDKLKTNIELQIIAFLELGLFIGSIIVLIYIYTIIKRKFDILKTNEYTRELPEYFPPAIASLLLDLNLENTTDYTATIAYLISKKYIRLSENGENVEIISNEPFYSQHEKYVFECVTKKNTFNQNHFKDLVIEDAQQMNLVRRGKIKINFRRNLSIAFFSTIFLEILHSFIKINWLNNIILIFLFISGVSIFAIIAYSIYLSSEKYNDKTVYRTAKGKIEAKKWVGLKNYLKNYTLISEKNLKDIAIFDDYIPYAIALNEAKTVEKFILNNEQYRKLIYGNRNYEA